ncbi:MAG: DUF4358 domain-containing protein [Oscillospiraceae bacterium]
MRLRNFAAMLILPIVMLTACSKAETADEMKQPAPADITAAIMAEIEIPSAVEKTKDDVGAYYDIDTEAAEALSVYICGSGAYPDELAVFKMNSAEDAENARAAVQKRLDSQIELYADYTPNEMYKLDGAKVVVKGNYVMLFACSDDDRAYEIADSLF